MCYLTVQCLHVQEKYLCSAASWTHVVLPVGGPQGVCSWFLQLAINETIPAWEFFTPEYASGEKVLLEWDLSLVLDYFQFIVTQVLHSVNPPLFLSRLHSLDLFITLQLFSRVKIVCIFLSWVCCNQVALLVQNAIVFFPFLTRIALLMFFSFFFFLVCLLVFRWSLPHV